MDARAQSIDHAASGFLRHRFMRAFSASWNVLVVSATLYAIGWATATTDLELEGMAENVIGVPIILVIVLALFMIPIIFGVGLLSAVTDSLHRRFVALTMLLLAGFVFLFSALAVLGNLAELGGVFPRSVMGIPTESTLAPWQLAVMFPLLILTTLIAFEATAWAWWQLTTSKAGFMAARGWRPPVWRVLSTFRRHLGLPAFIANFARGQMTLSALYFLVAVLNSGLVAALVLSLLAFAPEENAANPEADLIALGAVMASLLLLNLIGVGRMLDAIADRRATQLYQKVRDWDARAPIVFLRAFDQDDDKIPAIASDPFVKLPAGVGGARTLDEILLENGSPYGPLIAIGDPRDPTPPLGAARVFVPGEDSNWQSVVSSLVGAAKCIVMCPTTSAGVKWELELLSRSNTMERTIFLANPEVPIAETEPIFAALFLGSSGQFPEIKRGQTPIAAFRDAKLGWRVLTAKQRSQQTYTVALNMALQAMFGRAGVPLVRPNKAKTA